MRLGVNIDHVATLRQVRSGTAPDVVLAALICESSGADSIVAHLREDRRHIRDEDVRNLKKAVQGKFNLEMSVAADIVRIACEVKPDQATLVPERRQEITTEGGLDAALKFKAVKAAVDRLEKNGIPVSLFIDPDKKQIAASARMGVAMIELHTGRYAEARTRQKQSKCLEELSAAVRFAKSKGLKVFAGHGLDYSNVTAVARIKDIEELNIGYSIVCRSVMVGLGVAVKQMRELIN
jgi:pyridoxine 5-phosphate synthase